MMVSFIPCYTKFNPIEQLLRTIVAMLLAAALLSPFAARAEDIQIKFVEIDAIDEGYQFNADFEIVLNPILEKALKKGIVLYFVTDFKLLSPRWYWLDKIVARNKQRDALSYYALTRQYRLSGGALLQKQSFSTLKEALRILSRVRNRPIIATSELKKETEYIAKLHMRLDLSRLPKPFQVEALGSKEWNISSDRMQWKITLPSQRLILVDKP